MHKLRNRDAAIDVLNCTNYFATAETSVLQLIDQLSLISHNSANSLCFYYGTLTFSCICVCLSCAVCHLMFISVVGSKRVGVNPKVNNMLQGYEAASYELILISDGGLRSEYTAQ